MAKIVSLDSITIDKIAAGEVVESPAGCVKELIENSLDAGASEIVLDIQMGGRQKIEVQDNGCGISPEDLPLAVLRFATSKIRSIEDLDRLTTMGFRGEALSAISSVSQVLIVTSDGSRGNAPLFEASLLEIAGGVIAQRTQVVRERGTTITASNLFYNVPARKKFLRPPSKEAYEISRVVQAIGLANPQVSFKLIHDGVVEIDLAKETLQERICSLFPNVGPESILKVDWQGEGLSVTGCILSPKHQRANRSGQFISINKRPVHSLSLSYAVKDGFGPALDSTKHPMFFLNLDMDPSEVDVNIHPQKREVRLYQEEWVKTILRDQVSKALLLQSMPKQFAAPGNSAPSFFQTSIPLDFGFEEPSRGVQVQSSQLLFSETAYSVVSIQKTFAFILVEPSILQKLQITSDYPLMGVVSLSALRQKAAFVSFLLERSDGSESLQLFLQPHLIRLTEGESKVLTSLIPLLNRSGISLRPFGTSSFFVESVPKALLDLDIEKFIRELLEDGAYEIGRAINSAERLFFEKMAKIADRNLVFNGARSVRLLLDELFLQQEFKDLAGNPILHVFSEQELNKLFTT